MAFYNIFCENTVVYLTFCLKVTLVSRNFINFAPKFILLTIMAKLNRIKAVLAEQEKTSKWLAEQVGKSACTVSKWCSNTVQPDLNTLDNIAKLLDIDVKDLLNDTDK